MTDDGALDFERDFMPNWKQVYRRLLATFRDDPIVGRLDGDDLLLAAVMLTSLLVASVARLPEVNVDRVNVVTLLLQPTQNDGRVETTRIRKHTRGHVSSFAEISR